MTKKTEVIKGLRAVVLNAKGIKTKTDKIVKVAKIIPPTETITETKTTEIDAVTPTEIVSEKETEIVTPTEVISETETITETISESPTETTTTANSPSLFDMMSAPTEEDNKTDKTRLEHIAESISDDELKDDDFDLNEESPAMVKEMADVKATAMVEFGELVITLACMWIADDWSITAQETKFVIGIKKKRAIKISIMRVIIAKKKKTNPTLSIIMLCVGSAIPMLVIAVVTRMQKKRDLKAQNELIQKERALILERNQQVTENYVSAMNENEKVHTENVRNILNDTPEKTKDIKKIKSLSISKKETRGRHKKECASHQGKKCNCKG